MRLVGKTGTLIQKNPEKSGNEHNVKLLALDRCFSMVSGLEHCFSGSFVFRTLAATGLSLTMDYKRNL